MRRPWRGPSYFLKLFISIIFLISASTSPFITGQANAAGPTFVQVVATQPQTNQTAITVKFTKAQTVSDTNIIAVGWADTTATISSVKDSAGNTYAIAAPMTRGSTQSQAIYYAKNITAATANSNIVTVTFNTAAKFVDLRASEYSGLDTAAPLDMAASGFGSSNSPTTPSITTTFSSELIFAAGDTSGTFSAAGSGFTKRIITNPDSDITEDKTVSAIGSYNSSAKQNGDWVMQMATFRAATTVSGTPTPTPTPTPTIAPTSTPTPTAIPSGSPTPPQIPTPTPLSGKLVTIGDSYTSGYGAGPYIPGSGGCFVSQSNAYANYAASQLSALGGSITQSNYGCAGATTSNVISDGFSDLSGAKWVAMTIGINDYSYITDLGEGTFGLQPVQSHQANVTANVVKLINDAKKSAPSAQYYIIGYPDLMPPTDTNISSCFGSDASNYDLPTDHQIYTILNTALQNAASQTDATFVETSNEFVGHDMCAGLNSWFTPYGETDEWHPIPAGQQELGLLFSQTIEATNH